MGVNQDEYFNVPISDRRVFVGNNEAGNPLYAPCTVCCFEPTPDELAKLNAGGLIYLRTLGTGFAPMLLTVGDPDEQE